MTTANSSTHQRSMDWRLGLTDATTRPVPLPSDGNVVNECDTTQRTFAPIAPWLLPDTAAIAPDGHLTIGGMDVLALAEAVGTPVFIYDETHLRNRCREARRAFGDGVAYAFPKRFSARPWLRWSIKRG